MSVGIVCTLPFFHFVNSELLIVKANNQIHRCRKKIFFFVILFFRRFLDFWSKLKCVKVVSNQFSKNWFTYKSFVKFVDLCTNEIKKVVFSCEYNNKSMILCVIADHFCIYLFVFQISLLKATKVINGKFVALRRAAQWQIGVHVLTLSLIE